jgi:phage terminase large subunit-like protein
MSTAATRKELFRGEPGYGIGLMDQFIEEVASGKLLSNKYVKAAVKRHKDDLKNGHKRNLYFDRAAAEFAIDFALMLRHTVGDWRKKPFNLQPFQAFILGSLFGWLENVEIEGEKRIKRRFKKAYTEVARKNGKSELAAAIVLLMTFFDGEGAAEGYTAANKEKQAKICWDKADQMINMLRDESPGIANLIQVSKKSIFSLELTSKIVFMAADSKTEDGWNPYCGILDEYHEAPTSGMLDILESGMGGRLSPLLFIITTAGVYDETKPCVIIRKVVTDILEGSLEDDSFFGIIFTLDENDKWDDEKVWIKANPNIGKSPYWHNMQADCKGALNEGGSKEFTFKTKNLNLWVNSATTWIQDRYYKQTAGKFNWKDFKGMTAYGGFDLADKHDITALRICVPVDDKIYFFGKLYVPEAAVMESGVLKPSYENWIKKGYLTQTSGNTFDQEILIKDIEEYSSILDLKRFEYDIWNSIPVANALTEKGYDMNQLPLTIAHIGPATKEYETLIKSGKMVHDNNPIMQWMLSNVTLIHDSNGNYKPNRKKHKTKKIDGVMAELMAYVSYKNGISESPSVYEERGIFDWDAED